MQPMLRNILAIVAGLVIGSIVNMGLISVGGHAIPPPAGADVTMTAGLKAAMHLFGPEHFVFPFLAHALGTLAGEAVAARIAASHKFQVAMTIGAVFLAGEISMVMMLASPLWFDAHDLIACYLPMAWLGWTLAARMGGRHAAPADRLTQ